MQHSPRSSTPMATPEQLMARLWMRMIEAYGHRWSSQYGEIPAPHQSNPAMTTWGATLRDIAPRHLALGLDKCLRQHHPWPPTLPAFRALCQPTLDDYDLPKPETAWRLSQRPDTLATTHPAVRHAAEQLDHCPGPRQQAFLTLYRQLCSRVIDGTPLHAPINFPPAARPEEPPASPAEARHHLNELRRLTGQPSLPEKDPS